MRRVAIDGCDMTLDGRLGLNLYRDGRRPAVQGGKFGPSEAMRNPAGVEQAVVLDRLDGGVGAVERMVPHTYPLGIDACTRFSRAWTPSGEITDLPLPPYHAPPADPIYPTRIRAMALYKGGVMIGAGQVLYRVEDWAAGIEPVAFIDDPDIIENLLEFHGLLCIGTRDLVNGGPGVFYIWDGNVSSLTYGLHKSIDITSGPPEGQRSQAKRQFLVKTYMTINDVGGSRLVSNDTPYHFRFVADDSNPDPATSSLNLIEHLLDDSVWAGYNPPPADEHIYPVGDDSAPITGMAGSPLVMFFAKEDGVYHVGADGRAARIADWSFCQHPSNGEVFEFAYGGLYASNFRWGLVRIDVANMQVQWQTNACGPGANMPRVVPSTGWVTAFTMDGEWIVVPIFNGQDSYTFYGRPVEITERTAMINLSSPQSLNWHGSEGTFYSKRVTSVIQATMSVDDRPLLWVAWEWVNPMVPNPAHDPDEPVPEIPAEIPLHPAPFPEDGTPGISHISLPKYGTPLEDWLMGGPHRFQRESWLYYPRQDWGDDRAPGPYGGWSSVRKVFNRLDLSAEYLERYHTWIDAYMATTGGASDNIESGAGGHRLFWDRANQYDEYGNLISLWTPIGRFDEGERMSFVPGKTIQSGLKASLMLHGVGEPTHPFAFYGAKLRGTPMLEQSERRTYRVVIGRARRANQAMDSTYRLHAVNELWALQWADPVELLDHYHLPLIVDIEPDMSYEDVTEPSTGEPTIVVTFSCRILRRPFIWDAGYRFGSDVSWS